MGHKYKIVREYCHSVVYFLFFIISAMLIYILRACHVSAVRAGQHYHIINQFLSSELYVVCGNSSSGEPFVANAKLCQHANLMSVVKYEILFKKRPEIKVFGKRKLLDNNWRFTTFVFFIHLKVLKARTAPRTWTTAQTTCVKTTGPV